MHPRLRLLALTPFLLLVAHAAEPASLWKLSPAELRPLAESGDAWAQEVLGCKLDGSHEGIPRDAAESAKWLILAADKGDSVSALRLAAECLESGRGVPRDLRRALAFLEKYKAKGGDEAAERLERVAEEIAFEAELNSLRQSLGPRLVKSDPVARFRLAEKLASCPVGYTSPHAPEALANYRKAAAAGYVPAMSRLAGLLSDGYGAVGLYDSPDQVAARAEAARWREKAADAGDSAASLSLGSELVFAAKSAARSDHAKLAAEAERRLRAADREPHAAEVRRELASLSEVRANYVSACRRFDDLVVKEKSGDAAARYELGMWYAQQDETPPVKRDFTRAAELLRSAEAAGHAPAAAVIAYRLRHGQAGMPKDFLESLRFARRAAELEKVPAERARHLATLAEYYETGCGVAADLRMAEQLLAEAAALLPPPDNNRYSTASIVAAARTRIAAKSPRRMDYASALSLSRSPNPAVVSNLTDAAAAGDPVARDMLSKREAELARRAELLKKAETGGAEAKFAYALALNEPGTYLPPARDTHLHWLNLAAEGGHPGAMRLLGAHALSGFAGPADFRAAAVHWTRAVAAGVGDPDELRRQLVDKLGAAPLSSQPDEVVCFLADRDHPGALLLAYERARSSPLRKDTADTIAARVRHLARAARLGSPDALYAFAIALENSVESGAAFRHLPPTDLGGNSVDGRIFSVVVLEAAANAGHAEAARRLAFGQNQEVTKLWGYIAMRGRFAGEFLLPWPEKDNMYARLADEVRAAGGSGKILQFAEGMRWKREGDTDTFTRTGNTHGTRQWLTFLGDGISEHAPDAHLALALLSSESGDKSAALASLNRIAPGLRPEADKLRAGYALAASDAADRKAGRADSAERALRERVARGDAAAMWDLASHLNTRHYEAVRAAQPITGIAITAFEADQTRAALAAAKPLADEAAALIRRAADANHPGAAIIVAEQELKAGDPESARRRLRAVEAARVAAGAPESDTMRRMLAKPIAAAEAELRARWEKRLTAAEHDASLRFAIALDYTRGAGGVARDPALAYAWFAKPNPAPGAAYNAAVLALSGESFPASTSKALSLVATDPLPSPGFRLLHELAEAHALHATDAEAAASLPKNLLTLRDKPVAESAIPGAAWPTRIPEEFERLLGARAQTPAGPARESLDLRLRRCVESLDAWRRALGSLAVLEQQKTSALAENRKQSENAAQQLRNVRLRHDTVAHQPIVTKGTKMVQGGAYYEYKGMTYTMKNTLSGDPVQVEYELSSEEIDIQVKKRQEAQAASAALTAQIDKHYADAKVRHDAQAAEIELVRRASALAAERAKLAETLRGRLP